MRQSNNDDACGLQRETFNADKTPPAPRPCGQLKGQLSNLPFYRVKGKNYLQQ